MRRQRADNYIISERFQNELLRYSDAEPAFYERHYKSVVTEAVGDVRLYGAAFDEMLYVVVAAGSFYNERISEKLGKCQALAFRKRVA